jgi:hypothetical protein
VSTPPTQPLKIIKYEFNKRFNNAYTQEKYAITQSRRALDRERDQGAATHTREDARGEIMPDITHVWRRWGVVCGLLVHGREEPHTLNLVHGKI